MNEITYVVNNTTEFVEKLIERHPNKRLEILAYCSVVIGKNDAYFNTVVDNLKKFDKEKSEVTKKHQNYLKILFGDSEAFKNDDRRDGLIYVIMLRPELTSVLLSNTIQFPDLLPLIDKCWKDFSYNGIFKSLEVVKNLTNETVLTYDRSAFMNSRNKRYPYPKAW